MNKDNIILGIESSCDDTSAAIILNDKMLSNITAGQEVHEMYGGVVPELASRAHQQNIVPVIQAALNKANIELNDLTAIAFTKGPGLLGSLLVGASFAKSLSLGLNIPLIGVNHMKGHILAHFIQEEGKEKAVPQFPFICLTVSGGHTQLVKVTAPLEMEVIGETIDDAAGEAFDKAAKLLGLPYPGGPLIDKHAQKGNPDRFTFTFPKTTGYNYSFSGLKTQFMNFLKKELSKDESFIEHNLNDICASYQAHIINYLFKKLKKAAFDHNIHQIAIAGGVSANSRLRNELKRLGTKHAWKTFIPDFQYCTDNAGMIAITGYYQYLNQDFSTQATTPNARLKVNE
ncbi:MAG: tRNA (adenosine(37)-N6)-threonylcarbamoyltransferase complex transferase subunit TsaD [Flavobacteriales bacterium]|nr:tRNA (adenosine(37)-N6)-threonylcarbamoyltransferase complex transferase subunit TsaD [Flavobacteriales bacterium]